MTLLLVSVDVKHPVDYLHCDIFIFELTNVSLKLLVFTLGQLGLITLYTAAEVSEMMVNS